MNKQEILERVARHLFTQGKRAMYLGGCKYRTPDGLKCAIGALIPDELYQPSMESNGISSIIEIEPKLRGVFGVKDAVDKAFLGLLQRAHDEGLDPYLFRQNLLEVSNDYDLDFGPVEKIYEEVVDSRSAT